MDFTIKEYDEKQLFVCNNIHLPVRFRTICHFFHNTHFKQLPPLSTGYTSGYCHLGRLLGAAPILEHCLCQGKIFYYPKQRKEKHFFYY